MRTTQELGGTLLLTKMRSTIARKILVCAGFTLLGAVSIFAQQAPPASQASNSAATPAPSAPPAASTTPGQVQTPAPQEGEKTPEQANADRRKQIAEESAELVKLATDLKNEVDKTNKDTLSLGVIRKAEEIEKLAHTVKEKMKAAPGSH